MTKTESGSSVKSDPRKRIFILNVVFYVVLAITGVVLTLTGNPVYGEDATLSIVFTGLLFLPVFNHFVRSHSK